MTGNEALILTAAHWLCIGAGLGAAALLIQGLARVPVDGYPHCAACRYNLHGLPRETARCPECGADIRRPGQIRQGTYVRSRKYLLAGLLLAAMAVAGWYGAGGWIHSIERRRLDFFQAVARGDAREVGRLAALAPELLRDPSLADSVYLAIRAGKPAGLMQLSSLGVRFADLPRDAGDWTPLREAVGARADAILDLLLADGCDVNAPSRADRLTPLHVAVDCRNLYAITQLLKAGAKVEAEDSDWNTPLHRAVVRGADRKVAEALLDAGVPVDLRNRAGRTALHGAMQQCNSAMAWLLICRGADLSAADKSGRTPAQLAEAAGHASLAGSLWARVLLDAVAAGRQEHARALLRADPWALRPGNPPYSPVADWLAQPLLPLHGAQPVPWQDRAAVLKLLFEEGVSPNQANALGVSLPYRAVEEHQVELYQFLLEQGASPQIIPPAGQPDPPPSPRAPLQRTTPKSDPAAKLEAYD